MDTYGTEQFVTAQIDPGEGLLWCGTPGPGRAALQALPATLIGIPFAGFAVFWMATAYGMTSRGAHVPGPFQFFPLFGLPFLVIGLGMLTGPVWAWLAASRTVYAVTNKRALIITRVGGTSVRSFTAGDMSDLQRVERGNGSGDLYFATRSWVSSRGTPNLSKIGFIGIRDVRTVEQLIRSHLKQSAA